MTAHNLELSAHTPADVRVARTTLRQRLAAWECGNVPDALLVFSELVTNAVMHAGGAPRITIVHGERMLRLEVHDNAAGVPAAHPPDGATGGYGLNIVTRLSKDWGWAETPGGKVVWSNVPCCPEPS